MADLLVRAGALQSDECGADGKAAGGLTVYFKYCSGEKTAAEDFSPDATCADMYKAARSIASNITEMHFGGELIPDDSTPIADIGISQECCIHLDRQLAFLGTAFWQQEGSQQSQDEQDQLMNKACAERYGKGARAATFVEYSRKMIAQVPTGRRESGHPMNGYCCFTGPEGYGDDTSTPNPKKCTDDSSPFDGTHKHEHAYTGARLCIAVR
eukprot:TRINITY_DN1189_c0_g1_i2.p1 TRINITY_DN1189_c0_g1~~TRINITY_DN1189_c0_g1_i2.p1  ORF type:complete len:212 (+),score=33.15 TRINITY_DN1189_c0_g1_i2:59-694(+)